MPRIAFLLRLFAYLLMVPLISFAYDGDIVVRNGHHRAIAVIVLLHNGQLNPNAVVGSFEDKPITAKQLADWYEANRLYAYNETHSPRDAEDLIEKFDLAKVALASPSNPAGGIVITRRYSNDKVVLFQDTRQHGNQFRRPNCGDLMERLMGVAVR